MHYIETLVEVAREPFLILDKNLKVISANDAFYKIFRTTRKETVKRFVYDLGNNQWDIPELRKLLEEILPKSKVIKDYEVEHKFPKIGKRVIFLNARQLDNVQFIILAFEDYTEKRTSEVQAQEYTTQLEKEVDKRTESLGIRIKELEKLTKIMVGRELKMSELKKEITELKKEVTRIKKLKKLNGNGNNHNTLN